MKDWSEFLEGQQRQEYFITLMERLAEARTQGIIYPPQEDLFSCFMLCPYDQVKVVIIGQDPYHGEGQAHGLSFSVKPGVRIPPSLKNIYKELKSDLGVEIPSHGYLGSWAKQGVLMMNTSWSVAQGQAGSHKKFGWLAFTNQLLAQLNDYPEPLVFILWGNHAIEAAKGITNPAHYFIKGVHPSPLAANRGFFGSKPFSKTNEYLLLAGRKPIDWQVEPMTDNLLSV